MSSSGHHPDHHPVAGAHPGADGHHHPGYHPSVKPPEEQEEDEGPANNNNNNTDSHNNADNHHPDGTAAAGVPPPLPSQQQPPPPKNHLVLEAMDDHVDAFSHIPGHGFSLFLANRTKTIHFVRHGEGEHNVANRQGGGTHLPVRHATKGSWKYHDAKLTPTGIQQCLELRETLEASKIQPELVVTSPLTRALQAAHLIFGGQSKAGARPLFVVHDLCRERSGEYTCDKRRPKTAILQDVQPLFRKTGDVLDAESFGFPHEYDEAWTEQREESVHVLSRAVSFLQWLATRPEREMAVVTHRQWLSHLFRHFGHYGEGPSSSQHSSVNKDPHRLTGQAECRSICLALHRTFLPPGRYDASSGGAFVPHHASFQRGPWAPAPAVLAQWHQALAQGTPESRVAVTVPVPVGTTTTPTESLEGTTAAAATNSERTSADGAATVPMASTSTSSPGGTAAASTTTTAEGGGAPNNNTSGGAAAAATSSTDASAKVLTPEALQQFHEKTARRKSRVHRANFFEDDEEARSIRLNQTAFWHHCIQHLGLGNARKSCALCERKASTECVTCGIYLCNRRREDFPRACVEVWHDPKVKLGEEMRIRRDAAAAAVQSAKSGGGSSSSLLDSKKADKEPKVATAAGSSSSSDMMNNNKPHSNRSLPLFKPRPSGAVMAIVNAGQQQPQPPHEMDHDEGAPPPQELPEGRPKRKAAAMMGGGGGGMDEAAAAAATMEWSPPPGATTDLPHSFFALPRGSGHALPQQQHHHHREDATTAGMVSQHGGEEEAVKKRKAAPSSSSTAQI